MSGPGFTRTVEHEHLATRLDKVLARCFPKWSRRVLKEMLQEGRVTLNQKPARVETLAAVGDEVNIRPSDLDAPHVELEVLHESSEYLYINKPSGAHVIAKYPGQPNTIASALARQFPACVAASEDPRDGGAIHRLDGPTSGVLAVAKHLKAYQSARQAMRELQIHKSYLAAVDTLPHVQDPRLRVQESPDQACPPQLSSAFPDWAFLGPEPSLEIRALLGTVGRADKVGISNQGRPTHSTLSWLAKHPTLPRRRLVLLTLHTGMRHQLRVHLASLGHPIAHDATYGPQPDPRHRLALHAWRLDLGTLDQDCGPITAPPGSDFLQAAATGSTQ